MNPPRPEYPRPQFVRDQWINLNGTWDFCFDDHNEGLKQKWYHSFPAERRTIEVPFAFQTKLSGIHDTSFHDMVWYRRTFTVPSDWAGQEVILHFGAVDYRAWIYVNGQMSHYHEGGHVSFSARITHLLNGAENELVLRVEDPSEDQLIPRGKQYWHERSESIFYTRTTGIWQTVWLEAVNESHIDNIKFTPDIDSGDIITEYDIECTSEDGSRYELLTEISFQGELLVSDSFQVFEAYTKRAYNLRNRFAHRSNIHDNGWYWTPETPNLFDVKFVLKKNGSTVDQVDSYFGMRKVSADNGKFLLNNKKYYQKLILDQGYFPGGLLTAPSDEALKNDIVLAKQMGFNGARKHQKVEDPRYLYWADRLGFLVWGETANCVEFASQAVERLTKEWFEIVNRDYNHPSIVVWVPINESWGVSRIQLEERQQRHATAMYQLVKSLDSSRLVISNDGWEHTLSDLCTIHNYQSGEKMKEAYAALESAVATEPAGRAIYANGYSYRGEPILITEYGGIAFKMDQTEGWGYSSVQSGEMLIEAYRDATAALMESPVVQGFCYTQLTDVEQEINGLLTYDRKPKCDFAKIKEINDMKR
ncbi:glycoside hydrolase family 2 [Paenibacillus sp. sptzw28]|uniref:glycoside hydrolase family 2 protein n=1 Tax=Paenibacillus sp. sptzw28 TaxID=715179 RepID=UPI001C6E00A1|nr:sugar-binding domain-containing protein [Paenibacillus sp. sptzw28]QYR23154.1 glycoside hydrolase family 2 [Paenibacillus sp. sptzw28]